MLLCVFVSVCERESKRKRACVVAAVQRGCIIRAGNPLDEGRERGGRRRGRTNNRYREKRRERAGKTTQQQEARTININHPFIRIEIELHRIPTHDEQPTERRELEKKEEEEEEEDRN